MVKAILKPFLLGLVVLGAMFITMTQITMDMRLVLLLGSLFYIVIGYFSGNVRLHPLLNALLCILPFSIVLNAVSYSQLPHVVWYSAFYLIAAWLGVSIRRRIHYLNLGILLSFFIVLIYSAFAVVPDMLDSQLSEEKYEDVGQYHVYNMEGKKIESAELLGKVVVLDFFGTWCKPCLLEIKELEKVYERFKNDEDIVFFVVNTAEGGDTIEKMQAFIDAHDYPFQFGFDLNKELVEKFQLRGVPYLFVFDKEGNMRYKHVGYNKGETHFTSNLIDLIESLK